MAEATFYFPRGFLWGTATSSYQVEGNNRNTCWWAWEQESGRIKQGHKSGLACDWWGGRWREDFDRAAEGHQNAHRLSIEWGRVQIKPDRWDEDALDRYRQILRGLHERGMTPMVTLHHFNDPIWLMEQGGWENETAVTHFLAYVRKVVEALREYCTLWITFNEPNLWVIFGYIQGTFPPGKQDMRAAIQVATNITKAHAAAYRAIHELQPQARAAIAHHYQALQPSKSWFPPDSWAAGFLNGILNDAFARAAATGVLRLALVRRRIPEAKGTQDFIGLNYYTLSRVAFDLRRAGEMFARRFFAPGADLSDGGWLANEPQGLYQAIKWALGYNLPVIITENGVNDAEDHLRPRYLIQHLHQVWRAVNFNFPVKGYFHWSLVDNFEWERGWTQRFGLYGLDVKTQARIKRPSANLYAEICQENGLSSDMVKRYAPEIFEMMFPG